MNILSYLLNNSTNFFEIENTELRAATSTLQEGMAYDVMNKEYFTHKIENYFYFVANGNYLNDKAIY